MTPDVIIGLLTGLLIASGLVNGFQWYTRFDSAKHWRQRTREESDPFSKKYIPDTPESDPEWNDFRGETDEDIE
jgi:hypothetical protein